MVFWKTLRALSLVLALSVVSVAAEPVAAAARANAGESLGPLRRELVNALSLDLEPFVVTRPVVVYHWLERGSLDPSHPGFDEWLRGFLRARTSQGRNPRFFGREKNLAGDGFYTALNPSVGEVYGDSYIEVGLRAGARFVNASRRIGPYSSALLTSLGCPAFLNRASGLLASSRRTCRKLMKEFLRERGIDGFSYHWKDEFREPCPGTQLYQPEIAIVLVDDKNIDLARSRFRIPLRSECTERESLWFVQGCEGLNLSTPAARAEIAFEKTHFIACADYAEDARFTAKSR